MSETETPPVPSPRAVWRARKKAAAGEGTLSATIRAAFANWAAMKAEGATFGECAAALEKTIRLVWPFTREWHYVCASCDDVGLQYFACPGDSTCGRAGVHLPHPFGRPCWCAKGAAFVDKPKAADDFTAATKTTKQPTRFGR